MTEFNSYPVFVADQVLMADHLNEIVNYLGEQDRLTRNKLIGIGIVCGLELNVTPSQINITKGCGVTSAGYLIAQDEVTLSWYRPYELPADFFPKYKSIYDSWNMWELLTAEQSLEEEDAKSIEANKAFMRDKIVVLLLEMKEKPLKNCVDTDCDDKGEKIAFAIKPLLVRRADVDKFLERHHETPGANEPAPSVAPVLHDLALRRYNVPVTQLTSSDVVLNAFLELVNEPQLKRLAEVLNYCYVHYKPVLFEEPINPFSNVFELLKDRLALIKSSNPLFIQYYYDWIDDIIKAYHEFKEKIVDVQVMCCPDDDLFPLHLMLGEATKSTTIDIQSKYRHYFLYSPLFNKQKNLLAEVQLLFRRLKLLILNYVVPNPNTFHNKVVKITPSNYLDKPLSDRCIPYYYDPLELHQAWSWNKTRRGDAKYNLSYNAAQYNTADTIVNPLLYDIERFNFFRIEGHIGKNYTQALSSIIGQRNQFNLPFEVVALSASMVARYVAADDKECLFKDLESLYQVIIAELMCKFGDLACRVADIPYQLNVAAGTVGDLGLLREETAHIHTNINVNAGTNYSNASVGDAVSASSSLLNSLLSVAGLSLLNVPDYKKGDFLKKHCTVKKGTVGEVYLRVIDRGQSFTKPAETDTPNASTVYAHLFYFLDCVENALGASWPYLLKNYTPAIFNQRFALLTEEVRFIVEHANGITEVAPKLSLQGLLKRFPPLIHTCFDERLQALKNEYLKRYKELVALTNLMNYFKAHPGMEHKAGVPKGGTFIVVYHETPRRRRIHTNVDVLTHVPGAIRETVNINESVLGETHINTLMTEAAVKDPALLKNFQLALSKYLDACNDMDDNTRDDITDILVQIPGILVPTKFRIPEYAVIADFYLPYLCCSDCAPIAYVLPKTPDVILSIGITPTEFCNNDDRSYDVTVSPEGGALTASAGGVEQGTLVFKPKGLAAGINTLKYTLPDGRSASVDVKITEAMAIDFKFEVQRDGVTVKFIPGDTEITNAHWDFGDGTTSGELSPSHTYQFAEEEKEFIVKLSVKDGPCFSAIEHPVVLKRPVSVAFDIVPQLFCSRDERTYDFTTTPPTKALKDITNENKLVIMRNTSTGIVSFSPIKQKITATQDYKLVYQEKELVIRIVVPNADFIMRLTKVDESPTGTSGIVLHLEAKTENDHYSWELLLPERKLNFSGKTVDVSYTALNINPEQDLVVALTTRNNVPGVNCEDQKRFVITRDIFKVFLDKDPFDNNTTL